MFDQKQFDWKNPNYSDVLDERIRRLKWIRDNPAKLDGLKAYYAEHVADFINDWGVTFDPRSITNPNVPASMPFLLWDEQRHYIDWVLERMHRDESGIVEKSRDMGISWCSVGIGCALSVLPAYKGIVVGYGSRVEDLVDKIGDPDSLFYKARLFMQNLPREFRAGWIESKHAPYMRLIFPETGAVMKGQSGAEIGRGGRAKLYFFDEAAHHPQASLVDFALSQTTRCRIDLSSVKGRNNPFAQKRWSGNYKVFTFHWLKDPRKDQAWADAELKRLGPIVFAQEIEINYDASVEGILIPSAWVEAAVDAHIKLGFHPTGDRSAALDVADTGVDQNAFCGNHGPVIEVLEQWSGQNSDMAFTLGRAFALCDQHRYGKLNYDADGLGAGMRGIGRLMNEGRVVSGRIEMIAFQGSGAVVNPDKSDMDDDAVPPVPAEKRRKNKDMFENRKAQAAWSLRDRFWKTWKAVEAVKAGEKPEHKPGEMISLPSSLPHLVKLKQELSQPTVTWSKSGKMMIDKTPDGMPSPNLYDAVMIKMHSMGGGSWVMAKGLLAATGRPGAMAGVR